MIADLDPADESEAQIFSRLPASGVEHVLLDEGKKDSMAALSPQAPTRPIDPWSPLF